MTWTRLQASGSHLAPHLEKQMQEKPPEEREPKDKLRRGILAATGSACDCTLSKSAVQCQPYLGPDPFLSLIPS